jgi:hypothetical protein
VSEMLGHIICPTRFQATCSCGWRGRVYLTFTPAKRQLDRHQREHEVERCG